MKRIFVLLIAMAMVIGLYVPAHATLINRGTDTLGNRLIYDDDLNITWYDYTNSANSWQGQVNWADALSVTFGSDVYNDWRLPVTFDQTCGNYNCTNSEMGHLYYDELGNLAGGPLTNTSDFEHLQAGDYWSGTEYSAGPDLAWYFNSGSGGQGADGKGGYNYAMAVRPGDVSTSVPEPATMFLLGSGLVGMAVLRKRLGSRES